jgi:hypothetical protein
MKSEKDKKARIKPSKEIRKILKALAPELERLLDLTEDPGEEESVLSESIRSGARNLLIARKIAKGKGGGDE